jgi:archaellum component FlaC
VSKSFKIRKVRLVAAARSYEWEFADGVTVIEGPVGVGKTSLLELIRWGLGGNARLSEAVRKVGRQLALTVEIEGEELILLRGVATQKMRIVVHDAEGRPLATTQVGNPQAEDSISRFLLGRIGIPVVMVPRSRANPAGRQTSISFNDIYDYMYLQQTEIDRSTVNHLDSVRDPKRRSTFELIYGLIDKQTAELQVEAGTIAGEIEMAQASVREIDGFVATLELPLRDAIEDRIRSTEGASEALERELARLREEMRATASGANPLLRQAEELADALTATITQRERAIAQVENLQRLRAQVVLDEQRTVKAMLAGVQLSAIEFRTCPRCLQEVSGEPNAPDACVLCGQPEPPAFASVTLEDELDRLRGQLAETDHLLDDATKAASNADAEVQRLELHSSQARRAADEQARHAVTPFVDRVAQLSEQLGVLRSRRQGDLESLAIRSEVERRHSALQRLREHQAIVADRLAKAQAEREQAMTRVEELSEAFDEILQELKLPWYEPSEVDRKTYLPMVGGKRLEDLSSGGMKTLVNDAYFLAGFSYALRAPSETLLPSLMLIDTPRKNFGSNPDDSHASERVYRWMRRLQDSYPTGSFQLIVADNDIPAEAEQFSVMSFSYDEPLVDDLPHPGPENVTTLDFD